MIRAFANLLWMLKAARMCSVSAECARLRTRVAACWMFERDSHSIDLAHAETNASDSDGRIDLWRLGRSLRNRPVAPVRQWSSSDAAGHCQWRARLKRL